MSEIPSWDKYTEPARRVIQHAQEEAQRFNHNYIGTEHLLLGLVREGNGVAAKVLSYLGVDLNKVRSALETIIGRGDRAVMGEIGFTERFSKVLELTVKEMTRVNHHYIGTEHLLLGLVREGEGIAAGVLESLGVNLERVRTETMRILATNMPPTQPSTLSLASTQRGEVSEMFARLERLLNALPEHQRDSVLHVINAVVAAFEPIQSRP